MIRQRARVLIWVLISAVGLWFIGCAAPPNTNVSQNANTAKTTSTDVETAGDTCQGSLEEKLKKLQEKLDKRFKDDKDIAQQLGWGGFKFRITKGSGPNSGRIFLYLEGTIVGNDHLPDLLKIIETYMKRGCLERAIFLPPGAIEKVESLTTDPPGFIWEACEAPMIPCPGGICAEVCPVPEPAGNTNTNTRSNTNTNSNVNTSSNRPGSGP